MIHELGLLLISSIAHGTLQDARYGVSQLTREQTLLIQSPPHYAASVAFIATVEVSFETIEVSKYKLMFGKFSSTVGTIPLPIDRDGGKAPAHVFTSFLEARLMLSWISCG